MIASSKSSLKCLTIYIENQHWNYTYCNFLAVPVEIIPYKVNYVHRLGFASLKFRSNIEYFLLFFC
jgi:hypothetical protein